MVEFIPFYKGHLLHLLRWKVLHMNGIIHVKPQTMEDNLNHLFKGLQQKSSQRNMMTCHCEDWEKSWTLGHHLMQQGNSHPTLQTKLSLKA
jgi:hypothetical protein